MKIDKDLIEKVASAARLELTDDEINDFIPQLREVMENFKILEEADIEGVRASFQPIAVRNAMRDDIIQKSLKQEDALSNSRSKDGYFLGPRII